MQILFGEKNRRAAADGFTTSTRRTKDEGKQPLTMYLYDTSLTVYIISGSLDSSPARELLLDRSNPHDAWMGTPDPFAS